MTTTEKIETILKEINEKVKIISKCIPDMKNEVNVYIDMALNELKKSTSALMNDYIEKSLEEIKINTNLIMDKYIDELNKFTL